MFPDQLPPPHEETPLEQAIALVVLGVSALGVVGLYVWMHGYN